MKATKCILIVLLFALLAAGSLMPAAFAEEIPQMEVTEEEIADTVTVFLRQRVNHFKIQTCFEAADTNEVQARCDALVEKVSQALLCPHTGNPQEGDYLRYHILSCSFVPSFEVLSQNEGVYLQLTFSFDVEYYSTADQEQDVTERLGDVMGELDLEGKPTFEKVKAIHDYICYFVTYDYEHLGNEEYLTDHTAYAALIDGTATAQGFANLFYRMCMEAGLDARIVSGSGNGTVDHLWNIVKIGSYWYTADLAWDAIQIVESGELCSNNFLLGSQDPDHELAEEYQEPDFVQSHPMSEEDFGEDGFTITFLSEEGNDITDPDSARNGEQYIMPDLPYPEIIDEYEGTRFKEWSVVIGDADPVGVAAGETITVTADTMATAVLFHSVTLSDDIAGGVVTADKPDYAGGDTVTLTVIPDDGNVPGDIKYIYTPIGENEPTVTTFPAENILWNQETGAYVAAFTMPVRQVTVSATFVPVSQHFERTGEKEYTIKTTTGWNYFCDLLADNDKGIFDGKTVKLGKSITVSRLAAGDYHDFTGIFDGGGNTLTFKATATDNYLAPFRNVLGQSENAHAVIRNLNVVTTITATDCRHMAGLIAVAWGYVDVTNCHVTVNINSTTGSSNPTNLYPSGLASQVPKNSYLSVSGCTVNGTIATDGKYAAGYIGIVQGSAGIANSTSSVTINSSVNGDGTHGGFVGAQSNTLTLENCVFNGSLLGSSTNSCGGFVGWRDGTVNITNCIFAPSDTCSIDSNDSYTFSRRSGTVTNSYYTVPFGVAQGEAMGTLALQNGVNAFTEQGETYTQGNSVWYYPGTTVTLTVTPPAGYIMAENGLAVSYTDAQGETQHVELTQGTGEDADKWTFTMPSANVTATAELVRTATSWAELQAAFKAGGRVMLTQDITAGAGDSYLEVRGGNPVILDLNGKTLSRGLTEETFAGIVIHIFEGNLTITDSGTGGKVTGAYSSAYGCVLIEGGKLTLSGGSITGNRTGADGGGVFITDNNSPDSLILGEFIMTGGSISGNSSFRGGGVFIKGGTFTFSGGDITGNTSSYGGGVYALTNTDMAEENVPARHAKFTMTGGGISDNSATLNGGGVAICDSDSSFDFSAGTISYNTTGELGGGVYTSGKFTMSGGSITGNASINNGQINGGGGGVAVDYSTALFEMTGGRITGNSTAYSGGGVLVNGPFKISGNSVISDNVRHGTWDGTSGAYTGGSADNIHLITNAAITIAGELTPGNQYGVTMYEPTVFTSGYRTYYGSTDPNTIFISENPLHSIQLNDDGEAMLYEKHQVYVTGGTADKEVAAEGETVTITAAAPEGMRFIKWSVPADLVFVSGSSANDEVAQFTMPGNNVSVTANFQKMYTVTIDETSTKGKVTIAGSEDGFCKGDTVTLTVDESAVSDLACLCYEYTNSSGWVEIHDAIQGSGDLANQWTFTMTDADTIVRAVFFNQISTWDGLQCAFGYASSDPANPTLIILEENISADYYTSLLLYRDRYAILDLNGHNIYGSGAGGAIDILGGLTLTDSGTSGTIVCSADVDEAVLCIYGGSLTMNGGTIDGSGLPHGGILIEEGTLNLSGTQVIKGGVYLENNCVITIGGAMTNTAPIAVKMNTPGVFTSGWGTSMGDADPERFFTSADPAYMVRRNASGEAELVSMAEVFGTPDFTLPAALTTIEESAFEGVAGMRIVDASNCSSIGKDAFKDCTNLMQIKLPANCEIDPVAFDHEVYVFAPDDGLTKQCCDAQSNLIFVETPAN